MQVTYTQAKGYQVVAIPDGLQLMFFGKIDSTFFVIVALPEAFIKEIGDDYELDNKALIATGNELDVNLNFYNLCHGHKYVDGGGMVEWGGTGPCNREGIGFRGTDSSEAFYNGAKFNEVFFVS